MKNNLIITLLFTFSKIVFCSDMTGDRVFEPEVFLVEYRSGQIGMPTKSNQEPDNHIKHEVIRQYRQSLNNGDFDIPSTLKKVELLVSLDQNQVIHLFAAHFIINPPMNNRIYSFCINQ